MDNDLRLEQAAEPDSLLLRELPVSVYTAAVVLQLLLSLHVRQLAALFSLYPLCPLYTLSLWTYVKKVDTYATDLSVNFFAKRAGER
ncbi:hypothetical protein [Paenibacillus barcinonensis]|uniref:hypothetical protein n=1 Tax=Paenibacillus barcinonensis TaxID=198119 RepID=UPI0011B7161B|nr:hypothetical protein [Paenibacillus barcinonensis]